MTRFSNKSDLLEYAKSQEKILDCFDRRQFSSQDSRSNDRDPYSRDYARVIYSASFRRLQGKMQLLGVNHTNFHRNRLTHSLEVAQLARSLASDLGLQNPVVAETSALLHDIGNPPFGHAGEVILNKLCQDDGGYEGNAQALRIVRRLEKRSAGYSGLNLTYRTMFGITKYFYKREQNIKKFIYPEDYDFLSDFLTNEHKVVEKSIDAQIMDLCDEIAYAAHDLEDAIRMRLITIGEILYEFKINDNYSDAHEVLLDIVKETRRKSENCADENILDSSEEYSTVFKKELTATIVHKLYSDIDLIETGSVVKIGYKNYELLASGLKKLVFKALLRKNHIHEYEARGDKVIRGLFEVYCDDDFNRDLMLLPPELRALKFEFSKKRLVVDYISGMMDGFAAQEYIKYFGEAEYNRLYNK